MAHAEDLAYLRSKMGAAFENLISDWASELRELESEQANARLEIAQDVKSGKPVDTWLQPRPIRYRSKSA